MFYAAFWITNLICTITYYAVSVLDYHDLCSVCNIVWATVLFCIVFWISVLYVVYSGLCYIHMIHSRSLYIHVLILDHFIHVLFSRSQCNPYSQSLYLCSGSLCILQFSSL